MKIRITEYGNWEDVGDRLFRAVIVVFDDAGVPIWTGIGSTWPNPFDPDNPDRKTTDAYGCIRSGIYHWEYGDDAHNGEPGLNINNNQPIDAIARNPNQGGRLFLDHVDMHRAWNDTWRGSGGCLTVHVDDWDDFLAAVKNHCGELELVRMNNYEVYG